MSVWGITPGLEELRVEGPALVCSLSSRISELHPELMIQVNVV